MDKKIEVEIPVFDDSQSEICLAEINANDTIKELYHEMVALAENRDYDKAKTVYDEIISCNSGYRSYNKIIVTWSNFFTCNNINNSYAHVLDYIPALILDIEATLTGKGYDFNSSNNPNDKRKEPKIKYAFEMFLSKNESVRITLDESLSSNHSLRYTIDDLIKLKSKTGLIFKKHYIENDNKEGQKLLDLIYFKINRKIEHLKANTPSNDTLNTQSHVSQEIKNIAKETIEKEAKARIKEATIQFREEIGKIGYFDFFMRMAGESIETRAEIEIKKEKNIINKLINFFTNKDKANYIPNNFAELEKTYKGWLIFFITILAMINISLFFGYIYLFYCFNIRIEDINLYIFMASFNAILWFVIYRFNTLYSEARRAKNVLQEKMMLLSVVENEKFKDNSDLKAIIYTNVFERDFYIPRKTPENNTDISTILNFMKNTPKGHSGQQD